MVTLAVSPYYSHTKVALYDDYSFLWGESQYYTSMELELFPSVAQQEEFRAKRIMELISGKGDILSNIGVFVSVGGMLHPVDSGVYHISAEMVDDLLSCKYGESPMNMGAPIALRLANLAGARYALVVDPPTVDEMTGMAHITGLPDIKHKSVFHTLNHKAVAAKEADKLGKPVAECDFIVCNLDTTISVAAHRRGRVTDVNDIQSGSGPISPRQSGNLPPLQLVE
ncbi:MAG: butyrate kinase, partial [Synergistaceae bacterium]|nr:butyrate kinase [Synergistaceae bacterium]